MDTLPGMNTLQEIKVIMESIDEDNKKFFFLDNKAAGTRVRNNLQGLKKLAHKLRAEIQNTKATMCIESQRNQAFLNVTIGHTKAPRDPNNQETNASIGKLAKH